MAPIIIDIEASGFGALSYPIEIGMAMADGQRHSVLIRPAADWTHWDVSAESLHGIPRQTLLTHGKSVGEVTRQLNERLVDKVAYSDGWVVDKPSISTRKPGTAQASMRGLSSRAISDPGNPPISNRTSSDYRPKWFAEC